MLKQLKKLNLKTAVIMALTFYALVVVLHILILSGIVSHTWVNGGRSESFEMQLPISIINIVISLVAAMFTYIVSKKKVFKHKKLITFVFWFLFVLWTFGFLQQLLGTPFEKYVLSLLLFIGSISNLRLAIEKR